MGDLSFCRKIRQASCRLQAKRTENLEAFALRLRALAERRGLTQAEIARRLAIENPARVGNWFQGQNRPREHAGALARLLGTTTDFLLEGRYEPASGAPSKLSGPESLRIEEATASYRSARNTPMRITPGHEPPAAEPTEQNCQEHLAEYLRRGRPIPGWVGHTYLELRDKFPLEKPERLKQEPR
jgi:transcriptional regulator with XRE-family HTH domain